MACGTDVAARGSLLESIEAAWNQRPETSTNAGTAIQLEASKLMNYQTCIHYLYCSHSTVPDLVSWSDPDISWTQGVSASLLVSSAKCCLWSEEVKVIDWMVTERRSFQRLQPLSWLVDFNIIAPAMHALVSDRQCLLTVYSIQYKDTRIFICQWHLNVHRTLS